MTMTQGPQGPIRSQSQDKSKLAFKARLDQKATQLAQDDSSLPNTNSLTHKNTLNLKNQANVKKKN